MEYKILEAYETEKLELLVKQYIDAGWKVQGGVSVVYYRHRIQGNDIMTASDIATFKYVQAITK